MVTHLYICEEGGTMTLGIEGSPPKWVTCPICDKALECTSCPGAQLGGLAPPLTAGVVALYRCAAGHQRRLMYAGDAPPESAQCPDCDGMLLPAAA